MKKQITIATIGILMLASVMAITVYSGDSYSFKSVQFKNWTVVGNSSNMIGVDVTWANGNTTINFNPLFKPDNFTIVLFNASGETIREVNVPQIIYTGGGGGGSSTKYVDRNITQPLFFDRNITKTIEVEREVEIEKIVYDEEFFKLWHIILAMFLGVAFGWIITRKPKVKDTYNAERELEQSY